MQTSLLTLAHLASDVYDTRAADNPLAANWDQVRKNNRRYNFKPMSKPEAKPLDHAAELKSNWSKKYLYASGWRILYDYSLGAEDEFFGRLYGNIHTGPAVIALRGIDGCKVGSHSGTLSSQGNAIDKAWHFYQEALLFLYHQCQPHYFSSRPILTGHSLGGYLAQEISSTSFCSAVAFNTPLPSSHRKASGPLQDGPRDAYGGVITVDLLAGIAYIPKAALQLRSRFLDDLHLFTHDVGMNFHQDFGRFKQHPFRSTLGFAKDTLLGLGQVIAHPINTCHGFHTLFNNFYEANGRDKISMLARGATDLAEGEIATLGIGGVATVGLKAAKYASKLNKLKKVAEAAENSGKTIELTTRLNRTQIKEYLANIQNLPREQLIKDLESVGFKFRGRSKDGRFLSFSDKHSNKRIEIHPPDKVGTDYHHIHIFDKSGNSLNAALEKVPRNSPSAHIQIKDDYSFKPDLNN